MLHQSVASLGFNQKQVISLFEPPSKEKKRCYRFSLFPGGKSPEKAPPLVATELSQQLSEKSPHFISVKNLGPYLNFKLSKEAAFSIAHNVYA